MQHRNNRKQATNKKLQEAQGSKSQEPHAKDVVVPENEKPVKAKPQLQNTIEMDVDDLNDMIESYR